MRGLSVALVSGLPLKSSVPAATAVIALTARLTFVAGCTRRDPFFQYLDVKLQRLDLVLRVLVHD
jgi:hypothetical protein